MISFKKFKPFKPFKTMAGLLDDWNDLNGLNDLNPFLSYEPGAWQRHVDRGYRRRAGDTHRRRGPLSSHERRQCANEYTACQQHDVGHMKNSHGSSAEFDGRVSLNDGLGQRVGCDVNDTDNHHQHQ